MILTPRAYCIKFLTNQGFTGSSTRFLTGLGSYCFPDSARKHASRSGALGRRRGTLFWAREHTGVKAGPVPLFYLLIVLPRMTNVSIPILCFLTCTEQLREVRVTLPCTKRSCREGTVGSLALLQGIPVDSVTQGLSITHLHTWT